MAWHGSWEQMDSCARLYSWYSWRRALKRASLRERLYWQRGGLETGGLTEGDGPGEGMRETRGMDRAHHGTSSQSQHRGAGWKHARHIKHHTHDDACDKKQHYMRDLTKKKRLTFLSLVLEATGLITSEFPSPSPQTHV